MKTSLLTFIVGCICIVNTHAQSTYFPKSKIESITVYEKGAEVTRTIEMNEILGSGTIVVDSLPNDLTPTSIQVKGEEIKIESINHKRITERILLSKFEIDSIQRSIARWSDSLDFQKVQLESIKGEILLISKNDNFNTDKGVDIDALSKASDFYKNHLRDLRKEEMKCNKLISKLEKEILKLEHQLNQNGKISGYYYQVRIKVSEVDRNKSSLNLSYVLPNASWSSYYDFRIIDVDKKIGRIEHKAIIKQKTGENWDDVKITLSNRNMNRNTVLPSLEPNYIETRSQGKSNNLFYDYKHSNGMLSGLVLDSSGETLIGANVYWKGTSNGTTTGIDGKFNLSRKAKTNVIVVSYTGFETVEIDVSDQSFLVVTLSEGQLFDEVVVMGISSNSYDNRKEMNRPKKRTSLQIRKNKAFNLSIYELDNRVSISSNNESYDYLIQDQEVSFVTQYNIFPEESSESYLKVGCLNWRTMDLQSGDMNLFLEGQFVGQSKLDLSHAKDTLWTSLGSDQGITVKKSLIADYSKKTFFKNKTVEQKTFDIQVTNNKNKGYQIVVWDQIPVSNYDDVKIKVIEISGAEYDENRGFLKWDKYIEGGESFKMRIQYEIKYDKDITLTYN